MAYIKKNWDVKTFHKGDAEMISGLNHMEDGISEGAAGNIVNIEKYSDWGQRKIIITKKGGTQIPFYPGAQPLPSDCPGQMPQTKKTTAEVVQWLNAYLLRRGGDECNGGQIFTGNLYLTDGPLGGDLGVINTYDIVFKRISGSSTTGAGIWIIDCYSMAAQPGYWTVNSAESWGSGTPAWKYVICVPWMNMPDPLTTQEAQQGIHRFWDLQCEVVSNGGENIYEFKFTKNEDLTNKSADGTYVKKAIKSGDTITYKWVKE